MAPLAAVVAVRHPHRHLLNPDNEAKQLWGAVQPEDASSRSSVILYVPPQPQQQRRRRSRLRGPPENAAQPPSPLWPPSSPMSFSPGRSSSSSAPFHPSSSPSSSREVLCNCNCCISVHWIFHQDRDVHSIGASNIVAPALNPVCVAVQTKRHSSIALRKFFLDTNYPARNFELS